MGDKKLHIGYFLVIGLVISVLVVVFYVFKPTLAQWVDNKIYDTYLRLGEKVESSGGVAIVDIDEASLAEIGQWPWPRYLNAELLAGIVNSGAASVGFDILMSEVDRSSPKHIQENLNKFYGIEANFDGIPPEFIDNDEYFASILSQTNSVMGMYINFGPLIANNDNGSNTSIDNVVIPDGLNMAILATENAVPPETNLLKGNSLTTPIASLLNSATVGYINATADSDGVIRKIPLVMALETDNGTKVYPNLSLMSLIKAYGKNTAVVKTDIDGITGIKVGATEVPLEADGTFFVRFKGGRGVYPYISAADIIFGRHNPEDLAGKVVFVGSSAPGLLDIRINPYEAHYPGIEVHASVVDNILTQHFMSVPIWTPGMQVIGILLIGVLLALILSRVSAYFSLIIASALLVGVWVAGQEAFNAGFFISPLYIALTVALESIVILFVQFIFESIQKRKIKGAFSRYVSPVVVSQIAASGIDIFKGSEREVTIMFTDIRGFTTISEKLKPDQIVEMLNEYFTPMTLLIKNNYGTLDKFIGDAIMAFWNAPLDVEGHEKYAIETGIEMQVELAKLNVSLQERYGIQLKMGAGVNTGKVYVGNMGSEELLDYTIIGDNVNLASRLEGLCSKYGITLVVGESTMSKYPDDYHYLTIDRIKVKGKTEAVAVYYPIRHDAANLRKEELQLHEKAYQLYYNGEFSEAKLIYQQLVDGYKDLDTSVLYGIYLERCIELEQAPPEDWNGVWQYASK